MAMTTSEETASEWVLVTSRKGFFERDEIKAGRHEDRAHPRPSRVDRRLQQSLQNPALDAHARCPTET